MSASSKLEIIIASKADVGGFSAAEKSLGQLESRGQSAARGLSTLGTAATVAGGLLAAGLTGAVTAAANFESRMSAVKAASGATGSELAGLSAKALEFGAATDLAGIDANDAATAMEQLAKGGVGVSQMAEAAHGALLLASAGEISVAEAADTAVRAMNIFGLSGEQVGHVADVISAGANKSATDVGQLNAAFNQSASVAKGAGLSLEQLTGTLALLAQHGLQGSDAGTSLRTAIQRLTAPTDEASKAMDALGIRVFDANGKIRDFADIADNLKSALSGLSDEQRSAALQTIFGADAIRVANVLYKEGGTAVRTWTAAVNDSGSAARLGAERNNNLKGSIDQLKASLQTAAIVAGQALLPQIRGLTVGITGLVDRFTALSPHTQRLAVDAALGATGVLLLGGAIIKTTGYIGSLTTAVQSVVGAFAKKEAAKASLTTANTALQGSLAATGGAMTVLKGLITATTGALATFAALAALGVSVKIIFEMATGGGKSDTAENLLTGMWSQVSKGLRAAADHDPVGTDIGRKIARDWADSIDATIIEDKARHILGELGSMAAAGALAGVGLTTLGDAAQGASDGMGHLAAEEMAANAAMGTTPPVAKAASDALAGMGLAAFTGALGGAAAGVYNLATALGTLSAARGQLSGEMGILQERIDVLQQKQKEGIALSAAEESELTTLLVARDRLADKTGDLAAEERAHVLAMVGLNPAYGDNTAGANALTDATGKLGQMMGTGAIHGGELAQGINYAANAAAAGALKAEAYAGRIRDIPPAAETKITADTAAATGAVQSYGQKLKDIPPATTTVAGMDVGAATVQLQIFRAAINSVPRSFTVTPAVNLGPALSALASFDAQLPHSPAKEGPFRVLPNWDALFDGIAPALDRAKALVDQFGDDTLKKMIETISSISGAVKGGVEALTALGDFKVPHSDRAGLFAGALVPVVQSFVDSAAQFKEDGLKAAGTFADAAGKVVGVVKGGVDALTALSDFVRPTEQAIGDFKFAVEFLVRSLGDTAATMDADFVANAAAFSEGAGKALGILKTGVDGLTALIDFARPTDAAIGAFKFATEFLVRSVGDSAAVMNADFVAAAAKWSEGAGKALALLGNGVEGLSKLADFERPANQAIGAFKFAAEFLVQSLGDSAAVMDADFVAAAAKWSDGAGKALGLLGAGVDGLAKLADFVRPSDAAIDAFAAAVAYLVRRFGEVAGQMGTEGVAAAGAFGTAANSALTAAKTGIDAFVALAKLAVPSRQAIDELLAGIQYTVGRMGELADQFGKDGLARAVAFATAAGKVFATLKDAVDLMVKLEELKKLPGEAIQTLLDGVKMAVSKAIDLVAEAQELERQSILFAGAMSRAAGNFAAGVGGSVPISAGAGNGGGGYGTGPNITNVNVSGDVYDGARFEDRVVSAIAAGQSRGRL